MTNTAANARRRAASAAAKRNAITWREVLHGADWTRTAHGTYRHVDGRTVRYDGSGFVRYAADGAKIPAAGRYIRTEDWAEIRDWAIGDAAA